MLDYLPIFPELMEALAEFSDEQAGRLLRAMAAYVFDGTEPDFERGTPERYAWPLIRQRADAMIAKRAAKSAAGTQGGRPRKDPEPESTGKHGKADESEEKQTKADESREKQTKADGSEQKPQTQTQSQEQTQPHPQGEPLTVLPGGKDTHTTDPQESTAGARAGWYDPANPKAAADSAWIGSGSARKAVAQRILDYVIRQNRLKPSVIVADSGRVVGREIFDALQAAMEGGIPPERCQSMADGTKTVWEWELRLKAAAVRAGTAPPEWRDDLEDLRGEVEPGFLSYG